MSNVRQLGKFAFELSCADPQLESELLSLFSPCDGSATCEPATLTVGHNGVRETVNIALKYHIDCLWIDAAALISPNGKKVLIAGASHAGKSTCTTALALREKWKVLGEDIILFDLRDDKLLRFASPFSLKPGTEGRLKAHNCPVPTLVQDEWIALKDFAATEDVDANLDLAFFFEFFPDPENPQPLRLTQVPAAQLMRRLLPISNLLHNGGAVEKLTEYLAGARCYTLAGGTISERIDKLYELCGASKSTALAR